MKIKSIIGDSYLLVVRAFYDQKLRKGAIYLFILEVLHVVSGFISLWFISFFLHRTDFAIIGYVNSVLGILGFLSLGAVGNAVSYATGIGKEGSFVRAAQIRIKGCSIYALLLFIIGLVHLVVIKQNRIGWCLILVSLFIPLQAYDNTVPYLQGKGDFRRLFKFRLITIVAKLIVTVITILVTMNPVFIFSSQIGIISLIGLYMYFLIKRNLSNKELPGSFDKFSIRLSTANVAGAISKNIDRIWIAQYINLDTLAPYNLAKVVLVIFDSLGRLLNRLLFHRWIHDQTASNKKKLMFTIWAVFVASSTLLVIAYFISQFVVSTFFPKYLDALPYIPIFLMQGVLTLTSLTGANYMNALRVYHKNYIILLWLQPIFYTVLLFPLTVLLGALGSAISGLLMQMVANIYILIVLNIRRK